MIRLIRPTKELEEDALNFKQAGMDALYLSVERKNAPSVRTITRNGGLYVRSFTFEGEQAVVYKITLPSTDKGRHA